MKGVIKLHYRSSGRSPLLLFTFWPSSCESVIYKLELQWVVESCSVVLKNSDFADFGVTVKSIISVAVNSYLCI